ncbi:palmitoyltransferase ZDHHC15-like [Physella acuta]|uniref:palmitoyltransferase ZDHHC15-like n=1 Tax=Physella acuta TaxID=109671 RepID=UPI0027DC17A6|nr:palmitoyltransferase ZDHHC15-like [Physella acuta]
MTLARILSWAPVVGIIILACWVYYVYVIVLCLLTIEYLSEKLAYLFFFHPIFFMALWSFYRSVTTKPLQPPLQYALDEAEWTRLTHNYNWKHETKEVIELRIKLGLKTTPVDSGYGLPSYCHTCKNLKPDRCHHCSRCRTCVLKMDHHCPWINNCVGYHNYKYFLLFLAYVMTHILFVCLTSFRFIVDTCIMLHEKGLEAARDINRLQVFAMFFFYAAVGLTLSPLIKLHRDLLYTNVTTLESSRPVGLVGTVPNYETFDLGWKENLNQVFGDRKWLKLLPIFSSKGDGLSFPIFMCTEVTDKESVNKQSNPV